MKHKTTIICLLIIVHIFSAASAMAVSNSRMLNRHRSKLSVTIQEYINVWVQNKPDAAFKEPLTKLLKQHAMLLAYGIDANDDILVAHLFEDDGKSVSYRVYAARLFFRQLGKETGWKPELTAPLKDNQYRIKARNINNPLSEDEFNLVLP